MRTEAISQDNLAPLAALAVELWPDSSFEEELEGFRSTLHSDKETCYLVTDKDVYIAFIHVTLRFDYVEGADASPTAYIEGLYVKETYRKAGVAKLLLHTAEQWAIQKGCAQLASDTELSNSASIQFHLHNGFSEANRVVCFIKQLNIR
ncbi:MAG: GNAT family N-acetyltransferase [Chitinophagaceae bacterium]